jgi:hypothetical protein
MRLYCHGNAALCSIKKLRGRIIVVCQGGAEEEEKSRGERGAACEYFIELEHDRSAQTVLSLKRGRRYRG